MQAVYNDYFCGFERKEGNSSLAGNGFNFVLKSVHAGIINAWLTFPSLIMDSMWEADRE